MTSKSSMVLLIVVALAESVLAKRGVDLRAQLEQELGLSPRGIRKGSGVPKIQQNEPTDGAQLEGELQAKIQELHKSIVEAVKKSEHEAALKGMKEFIRLLQPMLVKTRDPNIINMGIQAYEELINYLKILNRPVEALVGANSFENLCQSIHRCDNQAARSLLSTLEMDYKLLDKFGLLQVLPGASKAQIKKSYMKLTLLLHPDKNIDEAESVVKFRESLLSKINDAYKELTSR